MFNCCFQIVNIQRLTITSKITSGNVNYILVFFSTSGKYNYKDNEYVYYQVAVVDLIASFKLLTFINKKNLHIPQ